LEKQNRWEGMEQVVGGGAPKSPVEAPYFTGVEHVEEPSECLCPLIDKTSDEYMMGCNESDFGQTRRLRHKPGTAGARTTWNRSGSGTMLCMKIWI
jgi:hypothetical protein